MVFAHARRLCFCAAVSAVAARCAGTADRTGAHAPEPSTRPVPTVDVAAEPVGPFARVSGCSSADPSAKNSDGSLKRGPAPCAPVPGSVLLCYEDFGPQALAYELLGVDWWAWNGGGNWEPGDSFDVRVVVYRPDARRRVREAYPSDPRRSLDNRLVAYAKAKRWLDSKIESLTKACANPDGEIECNLADSLRRTRDRVLALGAKP
jgi:hypothetical protein